MNNDKKIEEFVNLIYKNLNLKKVPVNLDEVAEKLHIMIKKSPSEDFSGFLIRKDGKALMGINSSESYCRQRFSIAHELGHFFLHTAQEAFVDYRDNKKGSELKRTKKEREANRFAASFLMPRDFLLRDIKKLSNKGIEKSDVKELARQYEVSVESMSYRIVNLLQARL